MSNQRLARRGFLATAGLGMAAALSRAGRAEAAEWTAQEKANAKAVTDFCAVWSSRDITKALPFLADDCIYRPTETTPAVRGHQGVTQTLKSSIENATSVEWRVLDTMAMGPIVINRRIDKSVSARSLTWEGIGVFFLKDGKIKEWTDYTIRMER